MALFSLICNLLACQKAAENSEHELSEITSVSISCGHTNRNNGYSFWVHKKDNCWLFDAECFTHNYEKETRFKDQSLNRKDEEKLFDILSKNESISYAENYKKSKMSSLRAVDDTVYAFCLCFSDEKQYLTNDRQKDLELYFYCLAEKYSK